MYDFYLHIFRKLDSFYIQGNMSIVGDPTHFCRFDRKYGCDSN